MVAEESRVQESNKREIELIIKKSLKKKKRKRVERKKNIDVLCDRDIETVSSDVYTFIVDDQDKIAIAIPSIKIISRFNRSV